MSPTDIPLDSSSSRRRPLRVSSALLVIVILVLGFALIREQRREARLREALAAYKHRSEGQIAAFIGGWLPVDLVWPEGTPLEVAIDRIKSASINETFPKGIPIYVDPDALRKAGETLKSPMKRLPPDPQRKLTFRQKLRLALEPMGLAYEVRDGSIMITTPDGVDNTDVADEFSDEGIAP